MKKIITVALLSCFGCINLLPVVITIVLAPIYIIATLLIVFILCKTKLIHGTLLSTTQLALSYVLLPQLLLLLFFIKDIIQANKPIIILFIIIITEIILVIGFIIVKYLSRYMMKRVHNYPPIV